MAPKKKKEEKKSGEDLINNEEENEDEDLDKGLNEEETDKDGDENPPLPIPNEKEEENEIEKKNEGTVSVADFNKMNMRMDTVMQMMMQLMDKNEKGPDQTTTNISSSSSSSSSSAAAAGGGGQPGSPTILNKNRSWASDDEDDREYEPVNPRNRNNSKVHPLYNEQADRNAVDKNRIIFAVYDKNSKEVQPQKPVVPATIGELFSGPAVMEKLGQDFLNYYGKGGVNTPQQLLPSRNFGVMMAKALKARHYDEKLGKMVDVTEENFINSEFAKYPQEFINCMFRTAAKAVTIVTPASIMEGISLDFGTDLMDVTARAQVIVFESLVREKAAPQIVNNQIMEDKLCEAMIKKLCWKKHRQLCTEQKFKTIDQMFNYLCVIADELDELMGRLRDRHVSMRELKELEEARTRGSQPKPKPGTYADKAKGGKIENGTPNVENNNKGKREGTCMLCNEKHFAFSKDFAKLCTSKTAPAEGSAEYNVILNKFKASKKAIDDKRKESAANKAKVM